MESKKNQKSKLKQKAKQTLKKREIYPTKAKLKWNKHWKNKKQKQHEKHKKQSCLVTLLGCRSLPITSTIKWVQSRVYLGSWQLRRLSTALSGMEVTLSSVVSCKHPNAEITMEPMENMSLPDAKNTQVEDMSHPEPDPSLPRKWVSGAIKWALCILCSFSFVLVLHDL